jgi:hypothetical protein
MMVKFILFLILLLFILNGCYVYTFNPGGKSDIKTIAILQFENKTIESGLSSQMTDLVVDAFISDGNMKVVSEESADAILVGILTSYNREAYTFDESDNVTEYVVKLVFDVTLEKSGEDEELWKEQFLSEGIYSAVDETEETGQQRAAEKLVTDIINRTTKNW